MRSQVLAITLTLTLVASAAHAETAVRDQVATFIESNMLNRTVSASYDSIISDGAVKTVVALSRTYANLTRTSTGLTWDFVQTVEQTLFDIVDGQVVTPGRVVNRVQTFTCKVRPLTYDTTHLIGFCETNFVSGYDATGAVGLVRIGLEGTKLVHEEKSGFPGDCFAAGGTFQPCMSESRIIHELVDGKLSSTMQSKTFYADPDSWTKLGLMNESNAITTEK